MLIPVILTAIWCFAVAAAVGAMTPNHNAPKPPPRTPPGKIATLNPRILR